MDLNGPKPPQRTARDFFFCILYLTHIWFSAVRIRNAYNTTDEETGEVVSQSFGSTFNRAFLESNCSKNLKASSTASCAALIILNNWEMGADYPW